MSKVEEKEKVDTFRFSVPARLITNDVRNFAITCSDMTNLYARKNHDYGDSFNKGMTDIGMAYSAGRLYDKMNRIISLLKNKAEVNDESIKDTLLDLACYSVMTYNFIVKNESDNS